MKILIKETLIDGVVFDLLISNNIIKKIGVNLKLDPTDRYNIIDGQDAALFLC